MQSDDSTPTAKVIPLIDWCYYPNCPDHPSPTPPRRPRQPTYHEWIEWIVAERRKHLRAVARQLPTPLRDTALEFFDTATDAADFIHYGELLDLAGIDSMEETWPTA